MKMKALIDNIDFIGIQLALANEPDLANEGIPFDEMNTVKAHPLHRLCDGVFTNKITEAEAIEMAKIFLKYGADVNGGQLIEKHDTPLIAAASLHADLLAMLYIENGADMNHAGTHGGTALHWAAWCGRDKVVKRILEEGAGINRRCIDFKATPLFWAIQGLKKGEVNNRVSHLECVKILIQSGAEKNIPNAEGRTVFDLLNEEDMDCKALLNSGRIS